MENLKPESKIESKEEGLMSKDFFKFQFEFAKELYNKTKQRNPNIELSHIIESVAPELRAQVLEYDQEKKGFLNDLKSGITEENLVDKAYEGYVKVEKESNRSIAYGPIQKFGPMYYLTAKDENINEEIGKDNISFHFSNKFDISPSQLLNIEERKKDIANLLKDIQSNHPNTKTLSTASWLLDAIPTDIVQKLFPQSFIDSMQVKESKVGWSLGTMIWGQFIDARGNLKKELAEELLKNLRNMKEDEYLIDLLKPPLHKPKSAVAKIDDFYSMYNI